MTISNQESAEILYREAWYLDNRRWDDWLSIYAEDAIYWVPAMVGDDDWTDNPDNDVSLMYMDRTGLEARIFRIESEDSYATDPLPHTAHLVTNVLTHGDSEGLIMVTASWMVRSYSRLRGEASRAGLYEFGLRETSDGLKIAHKKIFIHDDRIVGPIDIYNI